MAGPSSRSRAARAISSRSFTGPTTDSASRKDDSKLRSLIDKSPAATFIFAGRKNLLVNPAAEALTGYSRKELLKMDFWEFIHPDYREMIKQRGQARQRGVKIPPRYELKIIRKDGEERWLDYSGATIKFRGKAAVIGTAIDVTERKRAEAGLKRNLGHLRALHETSVAAMSTLELKSVLEILLEKIDRVMPCPAVSIIRVIDTATGALDARALRNISEEELKEFVPRGGQGLTRRVIEGKIPVFVADALQDPRTLFPEFFRRHGLVSYLGLPLILEDRVVGDLAFFTKSKHEFSDEELELLTSLATQAAVAIRNSQLYDQMRRRTDELAALNAVTMATTQSLDLNSVLNEAAKSIVELFQFDGARIFLFDEAMSEARLTSSFEIEPGSWTQVKIVRSTEGIIGRVAKTAEPVIFEDILTDPRYGQMSQTGGVKNAGARFFGVFPIRSKLKSWGALSCIVKKPARLSGGQVALLMAMCNQIGIAIENASLYQDSVERAKELSALYGVAGISAQFVDMNALLYQSIRKVCDIFGFTAARVYVVDKSSRESRLVAFDGFPAEMTPPRSYQEGMGLIGMIVDRGVPMIFEDMQNDPEYQRLAHTRSMLNAGFRASLFIPLKARGETLGVMNFVSKEVRTFSSGDVQLINSTAYHLGIAIGNANLFAQLRQKTEDLERANKAKDDFLSIMSHELRTPVNVILGYLDLMKQGAFGALTAELETSLSKVNGQVTALLSMIENILTATHIETATLRLERKEFSVAECFRRLRSAYELHPGNAVELIWLPPAQPVDLNTDADKLHRILRNLIDNAIKFTEFGSVTVSARAVPADNAVIFAVRDTGIGIAREQISAIFDIFHQLDSSTTRSHGGLGLGLYIVKHFAGLLGGSVAVESEPANGSTFTVTIPLAD